MSANQRKPQPEDLERILELIWSGKSLRATCTEIGLHVPSTSDWLTNDPARGEQYARAREGRAEFLQEDGLLVSRAAAMGTLVLTGDGAKRSKVDPSGAKAYLDAVKWATARMAPKTAPVEKVLHLFENMSDEELNARIRDLEAKRVADPDPED